MLDLAQASLFCSSKTLLNEIHNVCLFKMALLWNAPVFPIRFRQAHMAYHNMQYLLMNSLLTLTLPGPSAGVSLSGSLDSYCSLKPLCSGMGEVVPARTSPTLLPPSPRTVLSLSCFKVLQCINCRDWHFKS